MKNPNVWLRTSQYYYTTVILWIARNKLQYDSLNDRDKITTSQFSALKFNDCMDHVFSYLSEALDETRFKWILIVWGGGLKRWVFGQTALASRGRSVANFLVLN